MWQYSVGCRERGPRGDVRGPQKRNHAAGQGSGAGTAAHVHGSLLGPCDCDKPDESGLVPVNQLTADKCVQESSLDGTYGTPEGVTKPNLQRRPIHAHLHNPRARSRQSRRGGQGRGNVPTAKTGILWLRLTQRLRVRLRQLWQLRQVQETLEAPCDPCGFKEQDVASCCTCELPKTLPARHSCESRAKEAREGEFPRGIHETGTETNLL